MSIPIAAWIKEDDVARSVLFQAPPGLSAGWSVYYAVNDGTGTPAAMSSPTVTEVDATNMPGVYSLDIDEAAMTARGNANNFETVALHIEATGWNGTNIAFVLYNENP